MNCNAMGLTKHVLVTRSNNRLAQPQNTHKLKAHVRPNSKVYAYAEADTNTNTNTE
jgi:hypothetical protein